MNNARWCVRASVLCASLLAIACNTDRSRTYTMHDSPEPSEEPSASPPPIAEPEAGRPPVGGLVEDPGSIELLLGAMDEIGDGSEEFFQERFTQYLETDAALANLRDYYLSLPLAARGARWKAIHLIGLAPDRAALDLLAEVASAPARIVTSDQMEGPDGDVDASIRSSAAISLVKSAATKQDGAAALVDDVLQTAASDTAQLTALELFSLGLLSTEQREVLTGRGISANFRRLSQEETQELYRVSPDEEAHEGHSKSAAPIDSSVPSLDAQTGDEE